MFGNDREEHSNKKVNDLLTYLAHAQKGDHLNTVMELVRRLERAESRAPEGSMPVNTYHDPTLRERTVELPMPPRRVIYEL